MDRLVVSFLLLGEGAIIGSALLLVIVGGLITSQLLDVQIAFRRVTYIWCVALLGLGLSVSQVLWTLTPVAADTGLLWLLAGGALGAFVLFGAGLYYGSAARSRDIKGDTSSAWLGFVPIANLWLIFKRAERAMPQQRGVLSRYVLDPILIIGAILVIVASQLIGKALEEGPAYDLADSAALRTLVAEVQGVEERFAEEARLTRTQLPIRIDEITVLSDIEASGRTLRIFYDIERDIPGFRSNFKQTLAEIQCRPETLGSEILQGGMVEMIYRGPDGGTIATYAITQTDCGS